MVTFNKTYKNNNTPTSFGNRYLLRSSSQYASTSTNNLYSVFTPLTQTLYTSITFGLDQLLRVSFGRLVTISVTTLTSFNYVSTAALKSATIAAHASVAVFLMPILLLDTGFSTFLGSNSRTGTILEPLSRLLSLAMHSVVRTTCGTSLDIRVSSDRTVLLGFIRSMLTHVNSWITVLQSHPRYEKLS